MFALTHQPLIPVVECLLLSSAWYQWVVDLVELLLAAIKVKQTINTSVTMYGIVWKCNGRCTQVRLTLPNQSMYSIAITNDKAIFNNNYKAVLLAQSHIITVYFVNVCFKFILKHEGICWKTCQKVSIFAVILFLSCILGYFR